MRIFDLTDVEVEPDPDDPTRLTVDVRGTVLEVRASDDWAQGIVQDAAFMHVEASAPCRGYTMASSARAICGACGWQVSARLEDIGEERSARFALLVLAWIGLVAGIAAAAADEASCSR